MLFIARIEFEYDHPNRYFVVLRPTNFRFELNTRPRLAVDTLITVTLPGLVAPTHEALASWRLRHAPVDELGREHYRPFALADLMDAVNGDMFVQAGRAASADTISAFAHDRGGVLLSELRSELAGEAAVAAVTARAQRFAEILAIPYAPELFDELGRLHPVEHLMGLEHAIVQWIRTATGPLSKELAALARELPSSRTSAGASKLWFCWWWRLARSCTRADLKTITMRAVELANQECTRYPAARDTCVEAERMADCVRIATVARMWSKPPEDDVDLDAIVRDDSDAHYAAYMALTHAAHAIAAAARVELDAGDANRYAMKRLAELALAVLAAT